MLIDDIARSAIGLNTSYRVADGSVKPRIYLDSAASSLRLAIADEVMASLLPHYANTHTEVHFAAKICNQQYAWAHQVVLDFVQADNSKYSAIFLDSGATAALNRAAYNLKSSRPNKDVVICSVMEHHSNDLPHRKHFEHVIHAPTTDEFGCIDLATLETILKQFDGRVNYVAVAGVSNVTGIINPIYKIAEIAHRYDAKIIVDGAQMAPHLPIQVSHPDTPSHDIDVLCFAAHKIYAPGGPGVMVCENELLRNIEPQQMGGGMVEDVYSNRFILSPELTDREEAGTPNIIGAIGFAAVLQTLGHIGMEQVAKHDTQLTAYLFEQLLQIGGLRIYGDTQLKRSARTGAISFNLSGIHHGLTAAILNDYYNIAVRNACFCAHPYVRELVTEDMEALVEAHLHELDNQQLETLTEQTRGMVRASLGIYNCKSDIDALIAALNEIIAKQAYYRSVYTQVDKNTFIHNEFKFDSPTEFNTSAKVIETLNRLTNHAIITE